MTWVDSNHLPLKLLWKKLLRTTIKNFLVGIIVSEIKTIIFNDKDKLCSKAQQYGYDIVDQRLMDN